MIKIEEIKSAVPTVRRYVYASGRQTQFAITSPAKGRRGLRQEFLSEWLAQRWERDGKVTIVTVELP